jgi:integrase/recombinase XerD
MTGAASCLSWSMVSLKPAAEALITERVYPHSLRHSVAAILLERGMPSEQIQKLLGHTRLESTQVCVQSTTAMVKASYQKALSG